MTSSTADGVLAHIAGWQAAGLIDPATAERLRADRTAELASETGPSGLLDGAGPGSAAVPSGRGDAVPPAIRERPSAVAAAFGPSVTIAEIFGYLGVGFLLAAWSAYFARAADLGHDPVLGISSLIAAAVLIGAGRYLQGGDRRRARAAGVADLVAVDYVIVGVAALALSAGLDWPLVGVIGAAFGAATAIAVRWLHPALLTEIALLSALTSLAVTGLAWIESVIVPEPIWTEDGQLVASAGPDPLLLVLGAAAWWLAWAVLLGLIGRFEARPSAGGDEGSGRRAAIARFWAGMVAVLGLASAVSRSLDAVNGEWGRVLEPWLGDLALVLLCAALITLAVRRDATAYVYAAAVGLIVALTDFNFTYLAGSTEVGLFVEGVILLGVGLGADRLRRRIGRPGPTGGSRGVPVGPALSSP